jgi:hypothetical protein
MANVLGSSILSAPWAKNGTVLKTPMSKRFVKIVVFITENLTLWLLGNGAYRFALRY